MTSDEIKLKNVTSTPELLATVKELAKDNETNANSISALSDTFTEETEALTDKINTAIDEQLTIEDKDNNVKYKYAYTVENGHLVINFTKVES